MKPLAVMTVAVGVELDRALFLAVVHLLRVEGADDRVAGVLRLGEVGGGRDLDLVVAARAEQRAARQGDVEDDLCALGDLAVEGRFGRRRKGRNTAAAIRRSARWALVRRGAEGLFCDNLEAIRSIIQRRCLTSISGTNISCGRVSVQ